MIWNYFADIQSDVAENLWIQLGAVAVIIFLLAWDDISLRKENKTLRLENKQAILDRLQDSKDFAKIDAQPNEELKKFIGVLYNVWLESSSKPGEGK